MSRVNHVATQAKRTYAALKLAGRQAFLLSIMSLKRELSIRLQNPCGRPPWNSLIEPLNSDHH
jgi:hypothetical protein